MTPAHRPEVAAAPQATVFLLQARVGSVVRRVVITVNAPTDVTAGSRFEALTPEAISSRVQGRSPDSEVIRLRCDQPIQRLHAAQVGGAQYAVATANAVAENEMASWQFARSANVRRLDVQIGPSTDGGLTLPVTCVVRSSAVRPETAPSAPRNALAQAQAPDAAQPGDMPWA